MEFRNLSSVPCGKYVFLRPGDDSMRPLKIAAVFLSVSNISLCNVAIAQTALIEKSEIEALLLELEPSQTENAPNASSMSPAEIGQAVTPEYDPDESADSLNARQQIKQTFTLRRKIDGQVVETTQRTVTYNPRMPYRQTEAGQTTLEKLKSAFDNEVLTRNEAFEEAKLDFTIADINRDSSMSAEEFSDLVISWKETGLRLVGTPNVDSERQRRYDAFLAEISPETSNQKLKAKARKKFLFLTGGVEEVSRKDYIREYLLDFDSMDKDNDTILKGNELEWFRALNSGEPTEIFLETQPLN
ncbi:MAG: hypothetical protein JKX88_00800 [Marinicaulis sp.]|nr:hypothetical protein [Marinicaulis sp.]